MEDAGRVAAIVPCYNAGSRIRPVAEGILRVLPDLIVVDDGSTDGAAAALSELPVKLVRLPRNRGKGHALCAGFTEALRLPGLAAAVVLDADGQHDPAELPRFIATFRERQADLVIGARVFDAAHVPWRSRFGNQLTAWIVRRLFGHAVGDTQCGYRLLSRPFLEAVAREVSGGRYDTEMEILLKGLEEEWRVSFLPIQTLYETGNPSSHFRKVRDSARIYWRLFRAWRRRPRKR